jgi:hypothetical protein
VGGCQRGGGRRSEASLYMGDEGDRVRALRSPLEEMEGL